MITKRRRRRISVIVTVKAIIFLPFLQKPNGVNTGGRPARPVNTSNLMNNAIGAITLLVLDNNDDIRLTSTGTYNATSIFMPH